MSNENYLGNGGRKIIPSARKSIHSHTNCMFRNSHDMVRYGEDSSDDERAGPSATGTDEVDNVMSKMCYPSGSFAIKKVRSNSVTPPNQNYSDDFNDSMVAKSLPATLPSHSNCSIDETWQAYSPASNSQYERTYESARTPRSAQSIDRPLSNQHERMYQSAHTPRSAQSIDSPPSQQYERPYEYESARTSSSARSIDSLNSSYSNQSPNLSPRLSQSNYEDTDYENKSSGGPFFMSFLALLAVFAAVYYSGIFKSVLESNHVVYDEVRFHRDLNELGVKYKVGDNSILQLQTGISTIYKREDTSCLIFVYNSMKEDFDPNKFDGFVNNVASNAAKFLRNDTASVQHIVVDGSDLNMRSHSQLVKAYREDIVRTGVLLVRDVEHVPSTLAMAFHYYCDEYNPLVKKSAIFFTLNSAKCYNSGEQSSHASVEKCLKEKWSTVPKDNIGPLLTRVVSIVVDVTSGL